MLIGSPGVWTSCYTQMSRREMSFNEALDLVRINRPAARPNDGFEEFLRSGEFRQMCMARSGV
jgi:hypothetical protein